MGRGCLNTSPARRVLRQASARGGLTFGFCWTEVPFNLLPLIHNGEVARLARPQVTGITIKLYILDAYWSPYEILKVITRVLGGVGRFCPPHLFFANNLKTAARSAAKIGIPAHNLRTHLVCKFWLPKSNYFSANNSWTSGGRRLEVVSKRLSRGSESNDT